MNAKPSNHLGSCIIFWVSGRCEHPTAKKPRSDCWCPTARHFLHTMLVELVLSLKSLLAISILAEKALLLVDLLYMPSDVMLPRECLITTMGCTRIFYSLWNAPISVRSERVEMSFNGSCLLKSKTHRMPPSLYLIATLLRSEAGGVISINIDLPS
jgi:hypothetical protein